MDHVSQSLDVCYQNKKYKRWAERAKLVFTLRRVPSHACGSSQPQPSASWSIDQECSSVNSCEASDHQGWRTLPWGNTSCLLWGCRPADCQSCQPQKTLTQRFSLWLKAFSAAKGLGDQRSKNALEVQSQISELKSTGNSNCNRAQRICFLSTGTRTSLTELARIDANAFLLYYILLCLIAFHHL